MLQSEVEALLGGPAGNYGRNNSGRARMTLEGYFPPPESVERVWFDDTNRFEIYFDNQGQVVGYHKRAGFQQISTEGFFAKLWRKLRR